METQQHVIENRQVIGMALEQGVAAHHQLEKEALEIAKLKQDLRHGKIRLYLSVYGSILLLFGLVAERLTAIYQTERQIDLAVFNQVRDSYVALTDAACGIAACRTYDEVAKAAVVFNTIYYGRAHIVAKSDPNVVDAKIAFHRELVKYLKERPNQTPEEYFSGFAMDITHACRPNIDPRNK
jgi:hypothetical protein